MQVAIFGAGGGTGKLITERCLNAGHQVRVLLRNPAKFAPAERVTVVTGDAREAGPVSETVAGAQVVLSCLGAKSPFEKSDLLARAVPEIIAAMEQQGVRRLVALGAAMQPESMKRMNPLVRTMGKIMQQTLLKYPVESQRAQQAAIEASDLEWTIVAPPRLLNRAGRGVYRLDGEALPKGGVQIARADVADFMFRQIESGEWVRKTVFVAW